MNTASAGLFLGIIHRKFFNISESASISIKESLDIRLLSALFCNDETIRFESN